MHLSLTSNKLSTDLNPRVPNTAIYYSSKAEAAGRMTMDTLPPTHPPIPTQIVIDDDESSPVVTSSSPSPPTISRQLPLVDEIDLRQCFLFEGIPSASSMQGMVIGKEELNVMCGHRPRTSGMTCLIIL